MNKFFSAVFSIRYLAVVAVVGPFLGAALMLLYGATNVIDAYRVYFGFAEPEGAIEPGEAAMITLVASLDHFLFATILMIFGIGLYALFFASSRYTDNGGSAKHLGWRHVKNLGGMDEMLLKVIIMLLSVSFLEFVLHAGMSALNWTALVIPAAILTLGLCLRWMSASAAEEDESEKRSESVKALATSTHVSLKEMERLASLRDRNAISETEFTELKAQLLKTTE